MHRGVAFHWELEHWAKLKKTETKFAKAFFEEQINPLGGFSKTRLLVMFWPSCNFCILYFIFFAGTGV